MSNSSSSIPQNPPAGSVLFRLSRTQFNQAPEMSAVQAAADSYVTRGLETAADWRFVAGTLGVGALATRVVPLLSSARASFALRGVSALETAAVRTAPAAEGFFSQGGLALLRNSRMLGFGSATVMGASVLAGCSGSETDPTPPPVATSVNPSGSEYNLSVNPGTGTSQGLSLALNSAGHLVTAWADLNPSDSTQTGVFVRAFDPAGAGSDVANAHHPMGAIDGLPSVSSNPRGNFIVSWSTFSDLSAPSSISARRYDNAGRPVGATISVFPPAVHSVLPQSSIVALDDGGFVAVTKENSDSGSAFAHFYGSDNSAGTVTSLIPADIPVSALGTGLTVGDRWVWGAIVPSSGGNSNIRFQRFHGRTADGSVETHSIGNIGTGGAIRMAPLPNGDTMFVWQTNTGLFSQVLGSDGTPVTDPRQVVAASTATAAGFTLGSGFSVASDGRGSFVVAWEHGTSDGSSSQIRAQVFNGQGEPLFAPLDVSGAGGQNREAVVGANESGRVTIAWRRFSTTGGAHYDLVARNYQIAY